MIRLYPLPDSRSSDENQNCGILLFFNPQRISAVDPREAANKGGEAIAKNEGFSTSGTRSWSDSAADSIRERSWGPERGVMENRRGCDDTVVTGGEAEIACEGEAAQDKYEGEGYKSKQRELVKWVLTRRITNSDLEAADLDEDGVVGAAEFIVYN
ncbi:hypothetical protein HID58_003569 [Brassica napus]|uniref:Uncharacterized protein n=1 Tax=Brassica napus TaxID=3708 RepID=A0ABQ8EQH6_BRANA|nr:hypothetical protein HID58_003569 [Brassica napus]